MWGCHLAGLLLNENNNNAERLSARLSVRLHLTFAAICTSHFLHHVSDSSQKMRKIERRKWDADTRHIPTEIRFQTSPHFSIFMKSVDFFSDSSIYSIFGFSPIFCPSYSSSRVQFSAQRQKKTWRLTCVHIACVFLGARACVCDRWWSHGQPTDETGVSYFYAECCSSKKFQIKSDNSAAVFFLAGSYWQRAWLHIVLAFLFRFPFDFCFDAVAAPTTTMVAHRQRLTCADNVYEHPILTSWWMHLLCMHIYFECCTTKWDFRSATTTELCERLRRVWRPRYGSSRCNDLTTAMTTNAEWIICIRQFLVYGNLFWVFRK